MEYELKYVNAYLPMKNLTLLTNKTEGNVLLAMAFTMNGAGVPEGKNTLIVNDKTKKSLTELTGLTWGTIRSTMCELAKKGIIFRVSTGVYQINPLLLSKGEDEDIRDLQMEWFLELGETELRKCPELWKNFD